MILMEVFWISFCLRLCPNSNEGALYLIVCKVMIVVTALDLIMCKAMTDW